MEELLTLTNPEVPKDEFIRTLMALPSTVLSNLRVCLFEEAKENELVHSSDVLVTRSSASKPNIFMHAEDIWNLATSLLNLRDVPRTLVKNGKRSSGMLDSWRSSAKCQSLTENSSGAARSLPQVQFCPAPPSPLTTHDTPDTSKPPSQVAEEVIPLPSASLPPASSVASCMMMKDINIIKQEISEIRCAVNTLSESSSVPANWKK